MSDKGLWLAAFIIGTAIIAASLPGRPRYSLSAADSNVAWRMDTWSGQIDICAAAYLANGPVVQCGKLVVTQMPNAPTAPLPAEPPRPNSTQPTLPSEQPRSL